MSMLGSAPVVTSSGMSAGKGSMWANPDDVPKGLQPAIDRYVHMSRRTLDDLTAVLTERLSSILPKHTAVLVKTAAGTDVR